MEIWGPRPPAHHPLTQRMQVWHKKWHFLTSTLKIAPTIEVTCKEKEPLLVGLYKHCLDPLDGQEACLQWDLIAQCSHQK